MQTQTVTGKSGGIEYVGDIVIFETLKEYKSWLKDEKNDADPDTSVLKAVNDYEGRRQRQNLRGGPSRATGAREVNKLVSETLKTGQVSVEELKAAIAALQGGAFQAEDTEAAG